MTIDDIYNCDYSGSCMNRNLKFEDGCRFVVCDSRGRELDATIYDAFEFRDGHWRIIPGYMVYDSLIGKYLM